MDIIQYLIIGLVIYFIVTKFLPTPGVRQITTTQLKEELKDKNKQFIDVRTSMEYNANHIKEFKNMPLANLKNDANKLAKDKEVVVMCQSGMRSTSAAKLLKKQGFSKVTNVKGGMSAWRL